MSYDRLASRLYNCPLLITPEKAEIVERVFRAHLEGTAADLPKYEALERPGIQSQGMTFARNRAGYMRSDTGIALIQVVGTLVQRGSGMDAMSGLESYDNINAQLQAAVADPYVQGILIEFDSPGGEANGVAGLAEAIRAADAQKPVVAQANEMAFSAAYWLASAAGELYVPKTGMVGSVGVIMLHVDQSQANAKRGLDVTHITAGVRKADFSPHKPLSDAALSNAQAMVDRLYGQFVDDVAASRGIDSQVVRDTEAGLLNPEEALAIGMIDGIGSLDASLQRLTTLMDDQRQRKRYGGVAANASSTGQPKETTMSDAAKGAAPAAVITPEQLAAAEAKGLAEGKTTGAAETAKAAREAERARISAITTHAEAAGRTKLAEHLAHKTEMTVEEAIAMMAAAPKEAAPGAAGPTNRLGAAMDKLGNPKVGADAEPEQGKVTPPNAATVYAFRRDCVAKARNGKAA